MQNPRPGHVAGGLGQHQQGRLHRAHGPEIIDERRIATVLEIALAQGVPTGAAAQHVRQAEAILGQSVEELLALRHTGRVRVVQKAVQVGQFRGNGLLTGGARRAALPGVFKEHLLDVHHVRRDVVVAAAIGVTLPADEQHRKRDFGQSQQHLVNPARDPAAYVRPGAFQQQANIRHWRIMWGCVHNQHLARSAKGGRRNRSAGKAASKDGICA